MEMIKHYWKRLAFFLSIPAALGAAFVGLDQLGVSIPRVAWASEIVVVSNEVFKNRQMLLERELRDIRRQRYENLRQQRDYELKRQTPPRELVEEQADLENSMEKIQDNLNRIRTRLGK